MCSSDLHVVDRQRRRGVVVRDRPQARAVGNRRVDRIRQRHVERLGRLVQGVFQDRHGDRRRRAARRNAPAAAGRRVVRPRRRRTVRRGEGKAHVQTAGRRQADRERRRAGIFVHRHVVDRQRRGRVVVDDRAHSRGVGNRGVESTGHVDIERIGALAQGIFQDRHGDSG